MAVYGYVRVSTQHQADQGLSLDAQRQRVLGYAMMQGMDVEKIYVEQAVSGWKPIAQRKAGRQLLAALKPGDTLLCPKLDRLFRSAKDALEVADDLKRRKVSLHLLDLGGDITGNGISKMFFTIVAAFAEFERDRIAERIADVKANERNKGRYLGGSRPFGWRIDNGTLSPDPEEQKAIDTISVLRQQGLSLRQIAEEIASQGFALSHVSIRKILRDLDTRKADHDA